jgi:hypothetical protein
MNARVLLAATVCLVLDLGVPSAHAKKKKAPSEGVDVMCGGRASKAFVGKLFSIQPAARDITIKTKDGSKEFRIAGNCKFSTAEEAETDVACSIAPAKKPAK